MGGSPSFATGARDSDSDSAILFASTEFEGDAQCALASAGNERRGRNWAGGGGGRRRRRTERRVRYSRYPPGVVYRAPGRAARARAYGSPTQLHTCPRACKGRWRRIGGSVGRSLPASSCLSAVYGEASFKAECGGSHTHFLSRWGSLRLLSEVRFGGACCGWLAGWRGRR